MVSREVRSESNLGFDESLELDAVVSNHITRVLEMTGGKVHGELGAAQMLKVNPSTLRKRMRKLGIPFGRKWNKN
jgi:transcriptional regulator with GAF, ATPase, and Fis domain